MEQQTNNWLEWRAQGLGASDAPVIMGVSPYKTPYQLWLEKTYREAEPESNWAMRRGNDMERRARAHYELFTGLEMPAETLVHPLHDWIRASLDGYNGEVVLEIKCPGAADHALAKEGKIPPKYYPQLQHQLMVTNAKRVDYFSFDGTSGIIVEVLQDLDYQAKLFEEELKFWTLVFQKKSPPIIEAEIKISKNRELWDLVQSYLQTSDDEILARIKAKCPKKYRKIIVDQWAIYNDLNGIRVCSI